MWNPPFIDKNKSSRRSPNGEAANLFAEMARHEIRNITFTKARVVAELILSYTRQSLSRTDPELTERVASYRAGYLAELGWRRLIQGDRDDPVTLQPIYLHTESG